MYPDYKPLKKKSAQRPSGMIKNFHPAGLPETSLFVGLMGKKHALRPDRISKNVIECYYNAVDRKSAKLLKKFVYGDIEEGEIEFDLAIGDNDNLNSPKLNMNSPVLCHNSLSILNDSASPPKDVFVGQWLKFL